MQPLWRHQSRLLARAMPRRGIEWRQCPRFFSASSTSSASSCEQTIAELQQLLGKRLSTSTPVREHHGRDESYHAMAPPEAVAFAETTEEVAKILKICSRNGTPVVPFGAGSSLEGHISALNGGISLDLSNMNSVLSVEPEDMTCRVQAGVTRHQLNRELRATGLFFPVDPGADASIGGMVATNASGTTTVKYGNMKTNVMDLTAVLADGTIFRTGSKTRKSSAGYDLTRLLIGSEGTLGIVTEVQVRLHGVPEAEKTMVCSFESVQEAVETCSTIMQMGIGVARMEFMDETTVAAVNRYSKLDNPVRPSLLIEHHGSASEVEEQSAMVVDIAKDFNAKDVQVATSAEERRTLWHARHKAWYATLNQMPGSKGLSTDVAVPISRLADVVVATQQDLNESSLLGCIVGHVGDGNFHVMLPFIPEDQALMTKVREFSDRLVARALDAEGTCTGEHGVGTGKMDYLVKEHGDSIPVMRMIKNSLDPYHILNPGKIFALN